MCEKSTFTSHARWISSLHLVEKCDIANTQVICIYIIILTLVFFLTACATVLDIAAIVFFPAVHWGLFSVPSFGNEWYWEKLESGVPDVVNFHNRVYGCSGVMPDKFPCTGEKFL